MERGQLGIDDNMNSSVRESKYGRTIAARLKEDEMAVLEQLMAQNDLPNLTALLRGLLRGTLNLRIVNNAFVFVNKSGQSIPNVPGDEACGRRDLNPGYKLGGLVSSWRRQL